MGPGLFKDQERKLLLQRVLQRPLLLYLVGVDLVTSRRSERLGKSREMLVLASADLKSWCRELVAFAKEHFRCTLDLASRISKIGESSPSGCPEQDVSCALSTKSEEGS